MGPSSESTLIAVFICATDVKSRKISDLKITDRRNAERYVRKISHPWKDNYEI